MTSGHGDIEKLGRKWCSPSITIPILTWNGMIPSSMHFAHAFWCPGRTTYCRSWKNIEASLVKLRLSRGATAPPGRPERWGVWGAISGPPITQAPPLYNRPARAGKGDAGARLQSLADLLHGGEQARLVDEGLAIVVGQDPAVD